MAGEKLDVAIVGVGARTPIGLDAGEFWEGVLARRDGVREVPPERWDSALYWSPDPAAPDRTYSRIGGFLTGFAFDRKRFRLPPAVVDSMDDAQRVALASVEDALRDAGDALDRERCGVILGNALGGDRREKTAARVLFPEFARALVAADGWSDLPAELRDRLLRSVEANYKRPLPVLTEDTMPGELSNVIAGRVANVLDLGGSNYTVDAACASSLAALASAGRALRAGECDVVVSGGVDTGMSAATYVKFCKIGALSPDGSRPFDAGATGFVMGEGCAVFVLKRLEDAERAGDRIYAVVRAVGGSSDGRGKGITAPNPQGQLRAVRRAYAAAGVNPATVDLIEAHGTSTRVGDAAEATVLHQVWGDGRKSRPVALGSVKSQIGHLKAAAGAVGLLKATLALHHRVLPPTMHFASHNPACGIEGSSFRIQTEAEPWSEPPAGEPRRAGVSAFGFGGTNFHVVLEEWRPQSAGKSRVTVPEQSAGGPGGTVVVAEAQPAKPVAPVGEAEMVDRAQVEKALVDVLCAKTGYDAAEIELDFELEADLGVDTVKQAEILASVRERYGLPRDEKFRLADYPRLRDLADYVVRRIETVGGTATAHESTGRGATQPAAPSAPTASAPATPAPPPVSPTPTTPVELTGRGATQPATPVAAPASAPAAPTPGHHPDDVAKALIDVLCAKTGYDAAEIELDFELEADLGVDTVKQAEILASVRERYGLPRDEKFRLADYPRLRDLADYVMKRIETVGAATSAAAPTLREPNRTLLGGTVAESLRGQGAASADVQPRAEARGSDTGDPTAPSATAASAAAVVPAAPPTPELDGEVVTLGGVDEQSLAYALRSLAAECDAGGELRRLAASRRAGQEMPWRAALAATSIGELAGQARLAMDALLGGKGRTTLATKGVFLRGPQQPRPEGKTAWLFPGQGSQWVGMCEKLARRHPVVAETLREADAVMEPILGRPLTSFIFGAGFGEAGGDAEAALRMTTITQPAMVACDVAIARLLGEHGLRPDVVAGHSLGEYAACVVGGVLRVDEALRIVAARGREMAAATPAGGDPGWMAAVAAPLGVVEDVLRQVEGYVLPANKNSPSQTIIAGATDAVRKAMALFDARGVPCTRLPVSHAFHSAVVASASVPLRQVLDAADVHAPAIPVYSNVNAEPYPDSPDGIRTLLARQVASPVEFIGIVERMAASGVAVFVECGPKKALSGFVGEILAGRCVTACTTNLPKRGEIRSLLEGLATLWADGVPVDLDARSPGLDLRLGASAQPRAEARGSDAGSGPEPKTENRKPTTPSRPPSVPPPPVVVERPSRTPVVVSGLALGLPGVDDPFDPAHFDRLLRGETLFDSVPEGLRQEMVRKNVVRVVKAADGEPTMTAVKSTDDVIRLAARGHDVRLVEDYGASEELDGTLDATSRLALAATVEALREAGLPLVETKRPTRNGGFVGAGWRLPEAVGRETGVIFASAFPGYDRFASEIASRNNGGASKSFSRTFLLEVLALGHAQVAAFTGATGPNLQVNAACASTSLALATAEDWIRSGRCRRVIVVGADDVTSDALLPWIGTGFLATGAAATDERAEDAALPFDRRRHGMLLGMGAVALIVETAEACAERGVMPLAEVLATRCANSGGHALRLDSGHVAEVVEALVADAERLHGLARADLAPRCLFMSHETYTPARGGSASAEIAALRRAFGENARHVLVTNTKGYTGHPMGAGLEDAVALTALVRGEAPPIPNLREPDPELGDLNLSRGGPHECEYALRLAAGFGSQIACALYRRVAERLDGRIDATKHADWLRAVTGYARPETRVVRHTLRAVDATPKAERPAARVRPSIPPAPEGERLDPTSIDFGDLGGGRFRVWGVANEGLPPSAEAASVAGRALVVASDGGPRARELESELRRRGVRVLPLRYAEPAGDGADLEADLESALGFCFAVGRPLGIVNLLGITDACGDDAAQVHGRVRFLFHLARTFERQAGTPVADSFLITLTRNGGSCGIGTAPAGSTLGAALTGATKAVAREWAQAVVKAVDVSPLNGAADVVGAILAEAATADGMVEVGVAGGRRSPALAREVPSAGSPDLGPESVVVLTGGAGGITAAIGAELARRHRCRLAVLDIVARPPEGAENLDLEAERAAIRQRLTAMGERVTPARVDAELVPLRRAKGAATALTAYRAAGSEVHYESCDLSDRDAVARALDGVRKRFGRIGGVVHGAGVEESRPLASKTAAGFDRVFRGKALGALHLWALVRDDRPAFFTVFGSVAGRFGNEGQIDYSAANETVARLAWEITSNDPATRALAIDWTGWDGIGMAVAGGMRTILVERGVDLLPPEIGVPLAADLIDRGAIGEVVVCGKLGALAKPRIAGEAASVAAAPAVMVPSLPAPKSFDGSAAELREGGIGLAAPVDEAEVSLVLDPERQSFLFDHVIEGIPVLPGVVGLELMTQAARRVLGAGNVAIEDVSFERPVRAHPGRPVTVVARAKRGADGVECVLESRSTAATGRPLEAVHFRAKAAAMSDGGRDFAQSAPRTQRSAKGDPTLGPLGQLRLLEARGPEAPEIYRHFFHGPSFRVLTAATGVGPEGLVARAVIPPSAADATFGDLCGPRLREIGLQAAGLWTMCRHGVNALPHGIGRAERLDTPAPGREIVVRVRAKEGTTAAGTGARVHVFDVELLGEDGAVFERLRDVALIETGPLAGARPATASFLDSPESVDVRLDVLAASADVVAAAVLGPAEATLFRQIGSRKRRVDWLGGRVAAKRLVSAFLLETEGAAIRDKDIGVAADPRGAPVVRVAGRTDLEHLLPLLAISHGAGRAIAVLAPRNSGTRVGVDVERVEPRDEAFVRHVLTDDEARLAGAVGLNGDGATVLWTLKEAVTKALGVGMAVDPRDVRVVGMHEGEATVELVGEAEAHRASIGGRTLTARYVLDDSVATAWAMMEVDPSSAAPASVPSVPLPFGLARRGYLG
ncbi:MAG: SDR family NAD(P)-dependent oxidoreductase [Deltaproteobacteria bacterium]|nr:SDR family NAD(P)-dependent oxidoreductase [Deltaproteobacteria bacterium]